ncbi:MAG: thiamine diphosphokinase [Pseudomonadota bacterium]
MTYLGAGPAPIPVMRAALAHAPILVAVDGGVSHAAALSERPTRILGDLDSQPEALPEAFSDVPITHIAEQDSTDFDKALRSVPADLALGVGFLGGRVDHELACFHTLLRYAHRRVLLLSDTDVVTLASPRGVMRLTVDSRLSFFPLQPVRVTSTGVRWPLTAEWLDPRDRIGTSNIVTAGRVTLETSDPACLVIAPADCLAQMIDYRLQSEVWPEKRA